jgi:hypothetical protein
MKLCYCDESGTGDEPIAVMVGVIVDSQRMHVTKDHWGGLLTTLSRICGAQLSEIHTRDFYAGNGVWRGMGGPERSNVISTVFEWLKERKHDVVFTAAVKSSYYDALREERLPKELNTIWRFLAFHLILAVQKAHQRQASTKGNTVFIFDNEMREEDRFTDLVFAPPCWSDEYYERGKKQGTLDQIIDVPYFGDSQKVMLIQVADLIAFFLRRYAEISEGFTPPRFKDEMPKVQAWVRLLAECSIGRSMIYPTRARCQAADMFYQLAPKSIRDLG